MNLEQLWIISGDVKLEAVGTHGQYHAGGVPSHVLLRLNNADTHFL